MVFSEKIKKYTIFSGLFFFLFVLLGILFDYINPELSADFFSNIQQQFSFVRDFNFSTMFFFLFFNNTLTVFIGIFLGVLLGIIPVFFLAVNGFVVGLVIGRIYPTLGFFGVLANLLPHGIFELTALFIGSALGINLGMVAYREIKDGSLSVKEIFRAIKKLEFPEGNLKEGYTLAINGFLYIVLPLLFIAALIETYLIFYIV